MGTCIIFKLWHSNGVVLNATTTNLMQWLHIGHDRALRLYANMRRCTALFCIEGTTIHTASLRDKTAKINCRGKRYSGAVCVRFSADKEYTLKEICKTIDKYVTLACIQGKEKKGTISKAWKKNTNLCPYPVSMSTKSLAKKIGVSESTASRLTTRMSKEGSITKNKGSILYICDCNNKEDLEKVLAHTKRPSFTFYDNGKAWLVAPCTYSINDANASRCIRHKIYGYKSRTNNLNNGNQEVCTIPQLLGY